MKSEFKIISSLIKQNSHVLDVGCGDGVLMEYLLKEKKVNNKIPINPTQGQAESFANQLGGELIELYEMKEVDEKEEEEKKEKVKSKEKEVVQEPNDKSALLEPTLTADI